MIKSTLEEIIKRYAEHSYASGLIDDNLRMHLIEDAQNWISTLTPSQLDDMRSSLGFKESLTILNEVTRVEVIDNDGRSYVNSDEKNTTQVSFQDDSRTLKVFISNPNKKLYQLKRELITDGIRKISPYLVNLKQSMNDWIIMGSVDVENLELVKLKDKQ